MRCLVTGASGFVGSHLVRQLVAEGHEVVATVRHTSDLWRLNDTRKRIRLIFASLSAIQSVREVIVQFRPEVAFHLAWTGGNSSKFVNQPGQVFENVPGSLELVRILAETGCGALIYAGSSLEYGTFQIPVRETDLPFPSNLYGAAKYGAEVLVQGLCRSYGVRFCGARIFWTYGPMDDQLRMIPSVIASLLEGRRPRLTEGSQLWDFLYIDDAIRALVLLAETTGAAGIFNLGAGEPVSVRHVAELIRDLISPSLELVFGEVPFGSNQVMHLEPEVTRLRTATGWSPTIGLMEGLWRTVEWYRNMKANLTEMERR
ncbi:MAG: NAD-dependent epimerase/dehydratase family protein [Terracidiphilus sp.]